tara:strand:+ start:796 stop:1038 length:243 start_codon:yes stop_codon:yes gene_type:complete
MIHLDTLNFNSQKKLRFFLDLKIKEMKDAANVNFSIHKRDLKKTLFISLIVNDINKKTNKNNISKKKVELIKILKVIPLG